MKKAESGNKTFSPVDTGFIDKLKAAVGQEFVLVEGEQLQAAGRDETEDFFYQPEVLVKPGTAEETAKVLQICNEFRVPVTTRGAGTGLSGGALPVKGGVVLSTSRLNKIIEIDENNLQATVEPGVINQVFAEKVAEVGLFYPPDPASRGSCFLGGNIAHNSGGPKALKYGVTRDYVLNLQVATATGSLFWTGANTLKNSTGYNLTHLFIGSEGTLGIVTKIVFKLLPLPKHNLLMLVSFSSAEKACESVSAVFRAGISPSALEFMERDALDWVLEFVPDITLSVPDEVQAHLLVEVDGNDLDRLYTECEQLFTLFESFGAGEILLAENEKQKEELWKMRRKVAEAVKSNSVYKEEDTVVPRFRLPELLSGVKKIGRKYGFRSVCYGHAGDGNLHVNIVKGDMSDSAWDQQLPAGIREIFELTVSLGGTISGEHGIGWVQKDYLSIALAEESIRLQKEIKDVFDPNGILNPGKIFP